MTTLREALEANGPRIVVFDTAGTIDLLGQKIEITNGNLTVDASSAPGPVAIKNGSIQIKGGSNYVFKNLRIRCGDQVDSPDDFDAFTINGRISPIRQVLIDHCSFLWGPDIGGMAIIGDVADVTIQNTILGAGLFESEHSQSHAGGGHSTASNIAVIAPSDPEAARITFWRNLFYRSDARMPRVIGGTNIDFINNVIYNWGKDSAHGNPRSVNIVNNYYRAGSLMTRALGWRSQPDLDLGFGEHNRESVYLSGNVADGWNWAVDTAAVPGLYQPVLATSPRGTLSVVPQTAQQAFEAVLANVGARSPALDEVDQAIIDDVINRSSDTYYNGANYPPPNPYWPY